MGAPKGQKMVALWMEEEERDAFKTLCNTSGTDVSSVLRRFIRHALTEQSVELVAANAGSTSEVVNQDAYRAILKRLDGVERAMPKFDVDDLLKMRKEVLEGEFGTMRWRVGIVESQVQALGGSIAWQNKTEKSEIS